MQAKLPTVTPTGKASMGNSFVQSPNNSRMVAGKITDDGQALPPDALTATEAAANDASNPLSPKTESNKVNANLDLVKA